jgi:hypothetical protein
MSPKSVADGLAISKSRKDRLLNPLFPSTESSVDGLLVFLVALHSLPISSGLRFYLCLSFEVRDECYDRES